MGRKVVVTCLAMLAVWSVPLSAQRMDAKIIVDVPFRFHVGEQTFNAGQYAFASGNHILSIAAGNGLPKARMFTNSFSGTSPVSTGQAVFNCYREECFLFQVWFPGRDDGAQMLTSATESELRRNKGTRVYMALLGKKIMVRKAEGKRR